jgi:hypothetical protein
MSDSHLIMTVLGMVGTAVVFWLVVQRFFEAHRVALKPPVLPPVRASTTPPPLPMRKLVNSRLSVYSEAKAATDSFDRSMTAAMLTGSAMDGFFIGGNFAGAFLGEPIADSCISEDFDSMSF